MILLTLIKLPPKGGNQVGVLKKARSATRFRLGRNDRGGEFLHRLDSRCRGRRRGAPISINLAPCSDDHRHNRAGHVFSA